MAPPTSGQTIGSIDPIAPAAQVVFDISTRYIGSEEGHMGKRGQMALEALTLLRAVGGIGNWFLPSTTVRFFGFEHKPENDFLCRLTGAREMALAAGPVIAREEGRRQWLWLALACDILDTAAAWLAVRGGHYTRAQSGGLAAFSALCLGLTALVLADDSSSAAPARGDSEEGSTDQAACRSV
jgi:hypothetical protein